MNRIITFSNKQIAAVELGVELARHDAYKNGDNRYESFAKNTDSNGQFVSYTDKNKMFFNMVVDEAYDRTGLNKEKVPVIDAFTYSHFERAFFAVIEETINRINTKMEIEQAMMFAEVKSVAEGDNLLFHIPAQHLLTVSTVANGVRNVGFQALHEQDFTLTPKVKKAGVRLDVYKIATGMEDWGNLINIVTKSFRAKLQQEVVDAVYGSYSTLGTKFKEATFAESTYVQLAERIAALNGSPAFTVATKTALSKAIPTDNYFKMGLGEEWFKNGYIQAPLGIPTIKLEQSVKPNNTNYDFTISNDYLIILSANTDKPVKIGMEGSTSIRQSKDGDTADESRNYTITSKWEVELISQAYYAIVYVG
jgi:hypothetical protein